MKQSANIERSAPAVIVAEEYPLARMTLADLLASDGYQAFPAENLASAISQIGSAKNLTAVLVDLDMPGWEKIARHIAKTTRVPVIAMAGNCPVDKRELNERGICVCLRKPIVYDQVRESIAPLRFRADP